MDRGHLQRLGLGERRENPRKTLREHCFPDSRWTGQHDVMRTGRSDLQRPSGICLTGNVTEIRIALLMPVGGGGRFQRLLTTKPRNDICQAIGTQHLDTVHQTRFGQTPTRHHHPLPPRRLHREHSGQYPADRTQPAVQSQLTQKHCLRQASPRNGLGGVEDRQCQREVVHRATLGQRRRRQRENHSTVRPGTTRILHRGLDPITRFVQRGIGQSHQMGPRKTLTDIGFDLHQHSVDAVDRHRMGSPQGHQNAALT
ncbi:unannotated protein [freshwater metagenome]|uniref:Unannotated protein n=1 Tax=freshwater metagenome TaxID=449393 RepID=A0A6J7FCF6_9ZZZZ